MTLDKFMYHFGTNLQYYEFCRKPDGVLVLHDEWATPNPNIARRRAIFQAANFDSKPVIISFSRTPTARIEAAGEDHYKVIGTFENGLYTARIVSEKGEDILLEDLLLQKPAIEPASSNQPEQRIPPHADSENYSSDYNAWKNRNRN